MKRLDVEGERFVFVFQGQLCVCLGYAAGLTSDEVPLTVLKLVLAMSLVACAVRAR